MNNDKYSSLLLENQLCFPLYACSKEIIREYKPFLDELNLTYTQYITMMVLWNEREISVNDLGAYLYLDSGTLTPLLKKLESKGYLTRQRSSADERKLIVRITEKGVGLRKKAVKVPECIKQRVDLSEDEAVQLYKLLYKVLDGLNAG